MIIRLLTLLSVVSAVFCVSKIGTFEFPLWLLCVNYAIFLFIIGRNAHVKKLNSPGIMALIFTMFGRYSVLPAVYYYTQSYSMMASTYQFVDSAVYLMIYEQLFVFITFWICLRRKNNYANVSFFSFYRLKNEKIFLGVAIVVFIYIATNYKSLGSGLSVLRSGNLNKFTEINNSITTGVGYINIIWQALCVWIYVYLVMKQKALYINDSNKKHVYFSIIFSFLLILVSFIDQTSLSRWYTIVIAGSCLAFLRHLFPEQKKRASSLVLIPSILLLVFATMVKNLGYDNSGGKIDSTTVESMTSSLFDAYFSGPTNVNTSIALAKESNLGTLTIINDVLNNMPIVNHFLDPKKTSVYGFNEKLGRITVYREDGDQIIPLVGQSLIYFGFILAPLLSVLSVIIAFFFDDKFNRDFSYLKFCYGLIAIWFGVEAMMLNITINSAWIYIRIFPFWLLLLMSNKLSIVVKPAKTKEQSILVS